MRGSNMVRRVPEERGATAVLVAIMMLVLVLFLGFAINVGHMMLARGQLQNAADSGALAGVKDIGGNDISLLRASLGSARNSANTYSGYHITDAATPVSTPDVCLGRWELTTRTFQCISPTAATDATLANAEVYRINAVRVTGARNAQQTGGSLNVYMGGLFGRTTSDVAATAIAAKFGTCTGKCASPIVFAMCQIDSLPCGENALLMSNATEDDMGMTIYDEHRQANGPTIQDFLMEKVNGVWQCKPDICDAIPDPSTDPTNPTEIKIQNGNALQGTQSAVSLFDSLACLIGKTVDAGVADVTCSGTPLQPTFSGNGDPLIGFTRITVTDVDVTNKTITVIRECNSTENQGGTCQDFGLLSTRRYLVQ